jgi:hypothetical protein
MNEKQPKYIAENPVTQQILRSTAQISSKFRNGHIAYGTGFFYQLCQNGERHVPCLITNKHVVKDAIELTITYQFKETKSGHGKSEAGTLSIGNPINILREHPEKDVDLVAILLGKIVRDGIEAGLEPDYVAIDDVLIPTEEEEKEYFPTDTVVMVGYPNGLWDSANNMPIVRSGILSTLPKFDFNGKQEFVVDMACLNGSSGSPVFLLDTSYHTHIGNDMKVTPRFKLLGILYGGPNYEFQNEFQDINFSIRAPILNLGYVIKSKRIREIESMVEKQISEATVKPEENKPE